MKCRDHVGPTPLQCGAGLGVQREDFRCGTHGGGAQSECKCVKCLEH